MEWLNELLWGEGIAHSVMLLSIVIVGGILLGKVKIGGISLGITFVLFVGIFLGHFGFSIHPEILHFFKEFGLILFVYSVGMQVGPGFFSSFKKGGITLNMLAAGVVFLGVATTLIIHYITGIPMETMVGILSGAVTNTPGLGAAQQAYSDIHGESAPTIALGYAVAYPLGVVGIILAILCNQNTSVDELTFQTYPFLTVHLNLFADERLDRLRVIFGRDSKYFVIFVQYRIGRNDLHLLTVVVPNTRKHKLAVSHKCR